MKKTCFCMVGVFLALSAVGHAILTIESVEIAQTSGVTATYYTHDAVTGTSTINWSGGTTGLVLTNSFNYAEFTDVSVTASFTGMTDLSSGGVAKATFDTGTWSMSMSAGLIGVVNLAGTLSSVYTEEELPEGDALDGRAVVTVDTATFNFGYFGTLWSLSPLEVQWGDGNGLGGLIASILFPANYGITDYGDDYLSENATITLLADETAIPEPATMVILGLGALLLRRRRA